jgi:hypothetical protein
MKMTFQQFCVVGGKVGIPKDFSSHFGLLRDEGMFYPQAFRTSGQEELWEERENGRLFQSYLV